MYLKDKLNENDKKLLENINIKISNRQYGCGEIYEMAENCVFNGKYFIWKLMRIYHMNICF